MSESPNLYTVILQPELSVEAVSRWQWTELSVITTNAGDDPVTTLRGWFATQAQLMNLLNEIHAAGYQLVALRAETQKSSVVTSTSVEYGPALVLPPYCAPTTGCGTYGSSR